jgi:lipopolysaccharide transport system permease protein
MVKREILGRYRGSVIGVAWSFLHPILMLCVYTFVFGVVFKARWQSSASTEDFSLNLFAGLIAFNVFAECITRSSGLVLENVSYVKKVVFPLEILSPCILISSLFHALVSILILMLFFMSVHGIPSLSALWLPVVWLPFVLLVLGFSWFLSSLGVYLRDIGQIIGVSVTALMFLSPIFYPVSALPAGIQSWVFLNPLTWVISETRNVLLLGGTPNWVAGLSYTCASLVILVLGYTWFIKTEKGFADVI